MSKQTPSNRTPSNRTPSNKKPGNRGVRPPIDPLLLQRLETLGQRRPAGVELPPPAPGTAAKAASTANTAKARGPAPAPGSQEAKLAAATARAAAARAAKAGVPGARPVPAAGRKGKPAASSKVAALAVSVASTAALVGLFAQQDGNTSDSVILTGGTVAAGGLALTPATAAPATTLAPATTVAAAGGAAAPTTAAPTTAAPTTAAPVANAVKDGTYVGDGSRNRFGTVQVQVVYAGGQLTDVQILRYPDGDRRSIRINQYALPILISEAVQAQGSNINGVGGATYTSNSYYQSLQSALDVAKAQSGITG